MTDQHKETLAMFVSQGSKNRVSEERPYQAVGPFLINNSNYLIKKLFTVEPLPRPEGIKNHFEKAYGKGNATD